MLYQVDVCISRAFAIYDSVTIEADSPQEATSQAWDYGEPVCEPEELE